MSYRYSKQKINNFIKNIRFKECEFSYTRSSGPGGQNVNTRETKVQLSRTYSQTLYLPNKYKERLEEQASEYITQERILRLDAQVYRTQKANKDLLFKKLSTLIKNTFKEGKQRKTTRPPQHAIDSRIARKKRRSKSLQNRKIKKGFL